MSSITSLFGGSLAKRNCIGADNAPVSALYDYPDKMGSRYLAVCGTYGYNIIDIAYSGSIYALILRDNILYTSTDGLTKTARTVTGLVSPISLSYANGFFLLCGLGASSVCYYWKSTDGISWGSALSLPEAGSIQSSIIASASTHMFIANTSNQNIYQTSNGTSWTNITSKIVQTQAYYYACLNPITSETIGSYTFIYDTISGNTNTRIKYITTDSITYTNIAARNFIAIIYYNGLYYCFESPIQTAGDASNPNVYSTSDFTTYTLVRGFIPWDAIQYPVISDYTTNTSIMNGQSFWNMVYTTGQINSICKVVKIENKLLGAAIYSSPVTSQSLIQSSMAFVSDVKSDKLLVKGLFNSLEYSGGTSSGVYLGMVFAKVKMGDYYFTKTASPTNWGMVVYQITQQETYYP